ncbi:serine O-acetyltransferase EpsC [Brenneria nigrifluens]|uniref:serine O-acetyltransferase n=1 Tax=Brenneria nigrifluens DSM 30175 = ATCC 13028 TaxID=1121120 RepID=A0A2U1UR33_9GAMM|nr:MULTISPECIES: serine O-acetyltransferase EpsC [Brenneria]EHD22220.1 Serine O-acetyltransferase [Brenneria sp. EniD312]PWC24051.1 serine acetyltransferase [Brenneria nigrifluens] [Brenneria nigrifluens DSM 30175 = ATCC 13028]QCR05244.1 serine acetyltransferase [Brenneria nigrifluens] [Brenneria nigrifluens DSM 30175 = ATCC 13028]
MAEQDVGELLFIQQSHVNWHLDDVVKELSAVRQQWRRKYYPSDYLDKRLIPSKEKVSEIADTLIKGLYPMRLGISELRKENEDYYVGYLLGTALDRLAEEASLELRYYSGLQEQPGLQEQAARQEPRGATPPRDEDAAGFGEAVRRVKAFAARLPEIRKQLDNDILAAYQGDPAAHSVDEVLICYPGIYAVIHHRIAHQLYLLDLPLLARIISEKAHSQTGIDIHPGAQIDEGFFIDHGTGVVIGETAIIGKRVRIYQAVTLGAKRFITDSSGNLQKNYPRHPIIEDDVVIYAGATLLGRIRIGARSTIGGNVWLTRDVPPESNIRQASALQTQYKDGDGI